MNGTFFDGHTAQAHPVTLEPRKTELVIREPSGELARWAWERIRQRDVGPSHGAVTLGLHADDPAHLILPDRDVADAIRAACPNLAVARRPLANPIRYVAWTAIAAFIAFFSSTILLTVLSRSLAETMPLDYELAIADIPFDNWLADLEEQTGEPVGICESPDGLAALAKLMDPILAKTELPYDVTFFVTDYPGANAGAFPGGRILIYNGLFAVADEPRLFAAIMAHEIGHVHYRHMIATSLRQAALNGMPDLLLGAVPGADVVIDFLRRLNAARFTRDMETEADAYAHQLLIDAGLSPTDLADYFANSQLRAFEQSGILSYLNTHPFHEDRIEAASQAAAGQEVPAQVLLEDAEWEALTSICDGPEDG